MADQPLRASKRASKTHELKRPSSSPKDQHHQQPKKQQRKAENPVRIPPSSSEPSFDFNSLVCKNSACRATLSTDDTFCKRCSCCICHLFDDNKDPSLWLECTSQSSGTLVDSCGLSCHIECALQRGKVGVVDLGLLMQLDGSYCCASCGKVSGILGCWKKQLLIAKDARRVDILCYRIFLSYRLLDGTARFNELHELITAAKAKLETEVGPVNGVSAKMARGIVSRLSVAAEVQRLCSLALEKADEFMSSKCNATINFLGEGSLPIACKFLFEEVTSSSVVLLLIESSSALDNNIKGYKLWYCKTRDENYSKEPMCVFPRDQRRIWISHLQPCTEYSFRIISYADTGDYGHSEAKCFTKSVEIINHHRNSKNSSSPEKDNTSHVGGSSRQNSSTDILSVDSKFKVRDLGRILRLAWIQEQGCFDSFCGVHADKCCDIQESVKREERFDLNVASVPDLNEEFTPPTTESSRDEGNGCNLVEADDDVFSHRRKPGEVPAVDSKHCHILRRNREMMQDNSDSTLTNENGGLSSLDENFEYCVKIIRWLECESHIKKDFRLKFLTWFSLRSTEQERRVVNTFIQTLIDDPSCLVGQLVDFFSDISSRNGVLS